MRHVLYGSLWASPFLLCLALSTGLIWLDWPLIQPSGTLLSLFWVQVFGTGLIVGHCIAFEAMLSEQDRLRGELYNSLDALVVARQERDEARDELRRFLIHETRTLNASAQATSPN